MKKTEGLNKRMIIMAVAIGVLLLVSGVQAYQLVGLKTKLNTEITDLASSKPVKINTASSSEGNLKNNLKNLPQMVGGC